ncbi:MAG: T9SS type A sorting domain-containing protein [Chitinophagales bacterium]
MKVHFTYDICYLVDFDLYTGWGCDGYPANIFTNNCGLTDIQLGLDPIEPELQTQVLNKAYIFTDLCEELTFNVKVSNRDPGVVLNPTLDVKLPTGANMSIVSGFSTVTYKGQVFNSEPVSLGNNLYRWDINDIVPLIEANGVRPYAEKPDNDFFASVKIASGCAYISGSTIQFIANGEKSCGDPLLASTDATLPIKLNSAADYAQIYTPQIIQDIEDREHFTINVINQTGPDGDATSSDDHVYLVLPAGYSYTSGNIEFLKNAPTTIEPTVNTVDGATRLEWDFPANLGMNDTMIWEIDLNVDDLIVTCEDVNLFQAQTLTDLTDTCVATGQECGVLVASKDESFYFSKCSGTGTGLKSGLESNGDLAYKIALRNWNNREQNVKTIEERSRVEFLPRFNKAAIRNSHSMKKSAASKLINFIPEKGLYRTQAYISTPGDLASITNAEDIFAVDYMRDDNRFGAMLAIKTSEAVYEHSKVICDRFSGATLLGMEYLTTRNHSFIRYLLEQEDGSREYGISFVANTDDDVNYTIDNQWVLEQYKGTGTNYNFQVWSKTPDLTTNLVEKILKLLAAEGDIYFKNTANPPLPDVYVRNARYENGRLYMDIQNDNGATEITLNGNFKRTETSERESLELVLPITTEGIQTIETDIGSVYDIGFSMGNNLTPQIDQLYMADGIWFLDYERGLETINHYEVLPFDANLEVLENATSVYEVERDIQLDASVKSYISIIRNLRSRDRSMDLTPYDVLRFKVKGQGTLAVNLVKADLRMADQQFKRKVLLSGEEQLVEIPLADFLNDYGAVFTNDNVLSLVFTVIGDGQTFQEVSLDITDVLFAKTAQSEQAVFAPNSVGNYPNPFSEQTTVFFSLAENAPVVFSVYDAAGRLVHQQSADLLQGKNRIPFSGNSLQTGIYFYTIESVEAGLLLSNKMVVVGN